MKNIKLERKRGTNICSHNKTNDTSKIKRQQLSIALMYFLLATSFYIALLVFNSCLDISGFNYFSCQLRRFVDALFFALPFCFLFKRKYTLIPWIVFVNLYLLSNLWYYRNYGAIMPLNSFLMTNNLDGLGASIRLSMRAIDLLLIAPSVTFIIVYTCWYKNHTQSTPKHIWWIPTISLLCQLIIIIPSYIVHKPSYYGHPWGLFRNDPIRAYRQLGFINYWIYQSKYHHGCSDDEKDYATRFMATYQNNNKPLINITEKKNLILILVESLGTWPIEANIDGIDVMPNLKRMTQEEKAIYFSKVLPQTNHGRSSDAQLILNTGLLPIQTGATSSIYGHHTFPSIAKALKKRGYTSASFLCDDKSYWNQEITTKSYGFDNLYDRLGKGKSDKQYLYDEHLFNSSISILKDMPQPFYAQIVTMSSHDAIETPFESDLKNKTFESEAVRNISIIWQYVDHQIGSFIQQLKEHGLYDNSIIVITGDHEGITFNHYEGREKCELSDRFIPFIMLNSPLLADESCTIGQSDIYPSLLDAIGVDNYEFRGFGESVFRSHCGCAINKTGEIIGNNINDSLVQYKHKLWLVSDILIRMNYFAQ